MRRPQDLAPEATAAVPAAVPERLRKRERPRLDWASLELTGGPPQEPE